MKYYLRPLHNRFTFLLASLASAKDIRGGDRLITEEVVDNIPVLGEVFPPAAAPLVNDIVSGRSQRDLRGGKKDDCCDGNGIGLGALWGQAVEGIARQPEAEPKIVRAGVIGSLLILKGPEIANAQNLEEVGEVINALANYLAPEDTAPPATTPQP